MPRGRPAATDGSIPEQIDLKPFVMGIFIETLGVTMIGRFIGMTALVAALALPSLAQAQGVPGGIERGARDGERAAGPVGGVVGGVVAAWSEALPACWASMNARAFAAMWSSSTGPLIAMPRKSGSALFCPRRALPITMCRRNMASTIIATRS